MAKTAKRHTEPQRKRVIMTTKDGFKNIRPIKVSKAAKVSNHGVAKQRPEHPLSVAFSDSIEKERERIWGSAIATHDAAYKGLSQNLTRINDTYKQKHQSMVNIAKEFTAPFKDEELVWTSGDGKQTGTVTLSNRMRKLQKTLDAEQEELIRQWEEWVEAEAEIDRLAAEVVGQAIQIELPTRYEVNGQFISSDQIATGEELKAEKAHFQKLWDEAAKESLKAMKVNEKRKTAKQKRIEKQLLAVLREEAY